MENCNFVMQFWKKCQMEVQKVKQRFGLIGNHPALNRAIDIALQVAPTDLSVLIGGESGPGQNFSPKSFISSARGNMGPILPLTAGPFPRAPLIRNCSGMKKELLQVPQTAGRVISR